MLLDDPDNTLWFSAANLWEVTIKRGLGRHDFAIDPRLLRHGLLDNGYSELAITSDDAIAADLLPSIHKDPFDRILIAQSMIEAVTLLTADPMVARYPGPVRQVWRGGSVACRCNISKSAITEIAFRIHFVRGSDPDL